MKKLLISVLVLAVLIGGAVVALPKLVPMERIESEAKTRFKAATGRDLAYSDMRFTLWPNIGLKLTDVTVSNPDWAKNRNMLQLGELDVSLALRPLLDKRVEVKRFNLKKPVIDLETAPDGRNSWTLGGAAAKAADGGASSPGENAMQGYTVTLGEFKIDDGSVTFSDGKAVHVVEDVDLRFVMPDLASPMNLDGSVVYQGKKVNLVLGLEQPMELVNGKSSPGSLNVKTEDVDAALSGVFATAGAMLKGGKISANVSSMPGLIGWLTGAPAGNMPFTKMSVESGAEASAEALKLSGAAFSFDEINAGGDVSVNYAGKRPSVTARMSVDKIDLDRFTGGKAGSGVGGGGSGGDGSGGGWDSTPIDFSGLQAADADLILQTNGYSLKGVDVGPSNLTVKLNGGNLHFTSSPAALFGGTFSADLNLNASGATPTMNLRFKMNDVDAKPILVTFADFDKLSGKAEANVSVSGAGNSQRAIISSLDGNGGVTFRNGSLQGIDIVNIAKMIQNRLGQMGVGQGKTDFVELGGTFTVANGVAHNEDLKMKGPLVQATGKGDIDLPKKYLSYRVVPVLTASSAVEGASGIKVPVDIKGPFSNIKVQPDYGSVIKDALENPEDIKKTLKQAEDSIEPLKDNIKNLRKDIKKDPGKAIEGLLGGGLGGLMQPKEPAGGTTPAPAPAEEAAKAPAAAPADEPAAAAPAEPIPAEPPPAEPAPAEPAAP